MPQALDIIVIIKHIEHFIHIYHIFLLGEGDIGGGDICRLG